MARLSRKRLPAAAVALALFTSCSSDPGPASSAAGAAPPGRAEPVEWFAERAAETGLDFTHVNGASGNFYYPEILGPGVGLFDYDNDGDLDVYVAQGFALAAQPAGDAAPDRAASRSRGRLFRNDLRIGADGTPVLRFTDVTDESGITAHQYGLGIAAGDVDNDGWLDVLLTNFGTNQLFRNNRNGTFSDVSKTSGIEDASGRFAVSASFVDYDRDGWLDLYVANNVNYAISNATKCPNMAGARDYCPPQIYGAQPDRLYRNKGAGTFADVTAKALIGGRFGPALGVSTADFNDDGWIDIFVANDGQENLLWVNQRNGALREVGLVAGVAVTADGKAEASMGVDAGDFDNDGDEDLFMTELTGEGSNLYVNDGSAKFRDSGAVSGLGPASLPYTGWGTAWLDVDNDGWLDILSVNGTIVAAEGRADRAFPYDQRKVLFRNLQDGRFENVSARAGRAFDLSESGRGAAFGDIDNDGDIDVLVGNDAGPLRLLINNVGNRNHWLGLDLRGGPGSAARPMLGARVVVTVAGGPKLWRRARADGSYGSANDPRVLVGLGSASVISGIQVRWPSGRVEEWPGVAADRWTTITEGTGR